MLIDTEYNKTGDGVFSLKKNIIKDVHEYLQSQNIAYQ